MRKTNLMRSLKRRALPLLTSVAMAISMLSGTGVTAFAGYTEGTIHFSADAGNPEGFPAINKDQSVTLGILNDKLPDYKDLTTVTLGYTLVWEEYDSTLQNPTGRRFSPGVDTYGNVVGTSYDSYYLKASVRADIITISYNLDGGRWVDNRVDKKAFGTIKDPNQPNENLKRISNPVKDGFDFAGWDLTGDGTKEIAKDETINDQCSKIDTNCIWNNHNGTANLKALWTKNNDTLTKQYGLAAEQSALAKEKINDAEKAAKAAKEAAEAADAAAKAANDNPTADTAAAARKAAETAKAAAENATKAYGDAEAACKATNEAYKTLTADRNAASVNGAHIDDGLNTRINNLGAALKDLDKELADAKEETTTQAAAANKAAENALAAATEADKNDGSEPGKLAPVGSKLKDANGDYTGYVVTNADPSNPEVEYVATDADKKAKKISLPETVKDRSGNEYKVTSIAAKALERADVKEIIIPKSVKKIGDKAFYKSKAKKITIKTTKKGKIKIGDKAFRVKPDKAKIRVKGAKGKYKDKIVKHVKKNAKKTADVK